MKRLHSYSRMKGRSLSNGWYIKTAKMIVREKKKRKMLEVERICCSHSLDRVISVQFTLNFSGLDLSHDMHHCCIVLQNSQENNVSLLDRGSVGALETTWYGGNTTILIVSCERKCKCRPPYWRNFF